MTRENITTHDENPIDVQTTAVFWSSHTLSHTVPQTPLRYTSTLPSYTVEPPASRTGSVN